MDPAILTLSELNQVKPFMAFIEEPTTAAAAQTSKDGSAAPPATEEVEEKEDEGFQRRRSKQPAGGSIGEAPLSIPPIRQIPFMSPSSKFQFTSTC